MSLALRRLSALFVADSLVPSLLHRYFYNRLRRRLAEEDALKRLAVADPSLNREARMELITEAISSGDLDLENDAAVTVALEKGKATIANRVKETRANAIGDAIVTMAKEDHAGVVEGIKRMLGEKLGAEDLAVRSPSSSRSFSLVLTRISVVRPCRLSNASFLLRASFRPNNSHFSCTFIYILYPSPLERRVKRLDVTSAQRPESERRRAKQVKIAPGPSPLLFSRSLNEAN